MYRILFGHNTLSPGDLEEDDIFTMVKKAGTKLVASRKLRSHFCDQGRQPCGKYMRQYGKAFRNREEPVAEMSDKQEL